MAIVERLRARSRVCASLLSAICLHHRLICGALCFLACSRSPSVPLSDAICSVTSHSASDKILHGWVEREEWSKRALAVITSGKQAFYEQCLAAASIRRKRSNRSEEKCIQRLRLQQEQARPPVGRANAQEALPARGAEG